MLSSMNSDSGLMRCAIYTRKSVQQDVTHQFGSLEAQRSICSAYIASQQPKGWVELGPHYDDDGQSGSDLRRPALQELLCDIESGLIDIVVIYKLDRISRTLLDFVRLMDLMDQFGALQQSSRSQSRLYPALNDAFAKLEEADADLRRVIVDHPKLSDKERHRIAQLNRERVIEALNHITAVIMAFKGA